MGIDTNAEFHGSITLIQGSLMKKESLVDEDVIIEECKKLQTWKWMDRAAEKKRKKNQNQLSYFREHSNIPLVRQQRVLWK